MGVNLIFKNIFEKYKKQLYRLFKNSLYPYFKNDLFNKIYLNVKIESSFETLKLVESYMVQQKKGVYLRFGDGDVFLLKNSPDAFQEVNDKLAIEMEEAFLCTGTNVHKCLAIHSKIFGYEEGMTLGNHLNTDKLSKKLLFDTFQYFIGDKIYSPIALHFMATQNITQANSFLKILKTMTKVFIGNKNLNPNTKNLLFGNAVHIKTPSKNAYNEIERIFEEAKLEVEKLNSFAVVCVAMGCSGRPLMKRLYLKDYNIYLFDFGSLLDGFDGINSRTWLKVNDINYKKLTEDLN